MLGLRRVGDVVRGVALLLAWRGLQRVDRFREPLDRGGVFRRRGRRGGRSLARRLAELGEPAVREIGKELHACDVVERECERDLLGRTLHAEEGVSRQARGGDGAGDRDDGERYRARGERGTEPQEGRACRPRRQDRLRLAHELVAELGAERVAHHRTGEALGEVSVEIVHASASREGMSSRSAARARNWMPRTVPSRLPTSVAISAVVWPSM